MNRMTFKKPRRRLLALLAATSILFSTSSIAAPTDDRKVVAELDLAYQAAVKRNDAETMDKILHRKFALVRGDGTTVSREEIVGGARGGEYQYEQQDEVPGTQVVRVWGDTAVVTALLWAKGVHKGKPFEYRVWFSDTYVRTKEGWKYAFAQVSLPLPKSEDE